MKNIELTSEGLHITEGVGGVYFYHLSEVGTNARLCCINYAEFVIPQTAV
jgi:hypothetical protein